MASEKPQFVAFRGIYKKLGSGYNVEKSILIIQCNSVKIRGKLLHIKENA